MNYNLDIVAGELLHLRRHGWCTLQKKQSKLVEIMKNILEECRQEYTWYESSTKVRFLIVNK